MFELPEIVRGFNVYTYTFLDDLSFIKAPEEVFQYEEPDKLEKFIHEIKRKFKEAGWEGDGTIGILWMPPFVDVGVEDTYGTYVWHVKQQNDGISFIISEYPINFERLRNQNDRDTASWRERGKPINIIHHDVLYLRKTALEFATELKLCLETIDLIENNDVKAKLRESYLINSQGMLVRALQEFLDGCYLDFLIEVINDGNPSKIKIRKSRVQLSPDDYLPEDIDEDGATWLTLRGITSDMWKAYKFESFNNKLEMLFKSVDYDCNKEIKFNLVKQVLLRNCIQHHSGQLDPSCLKQCGVESFTILDKENSHELVKWKMVFFTIEELLNFCTHLISLADNFNTYIDQRIPTRHFMVTHEDSN